MKQTTHSTTRAMLVIAVAAAVGLGARAAGADGFASILMAYDATPVSGTQQAVQLVYPSGFPLEAPALLFVRESEAPCAAPEDCWQDYDVYDIGTTGKYVYQTPDEPGLTVSFFVVAVNGHAVAVSDFGAIEIQAAGGAAPPTTFGRRSWMAPPSMHEALLQPSDWPDTLKTIDVASFYVGQLLPRPGIPTDEDLAAFVALTRPLHDHGVRVSVEVGGLRPHACTAEEAFAGDRPAFEKLDAAGFGDFIVKLDNTLSYVASTGYHPNPCQYTVAEAASELVHYMEIVQQRYGDQVEFGLIMSPHFYSFHAYPPTDPLGGTWIGDLEIALGSIHAEAAEKGIEVGFMHADGGLAQFVNPFLHPVVVGQQWSKWLAIQQFVQSLGMRFGMLLNFNQPCSTCGPNESISSDQEFHEGILAQHDCFVTQGGILDDIVPQSWWTDTPSQIAPETQPHSFTYTLLALEQHAAQPPEQLECPKVSFEQGKFVIE